MIFKSREQGLCQSKGSRFRGNEGFRRNENLTCGREKISGKRSKFRYDGKSLCFAISDNVSTCILRFKISWSISFCRGTKGYGH